jgi:hypothetical protein
LHFIRHFLIGDNSMPAPAKTATKTPAKTATKAATKPAVKAAVTTPAKAAVKPAVAAPAKAAPAAKKAAAPAKKAAAPAKKAAAPAKAGGRKKAAPILPAQRNHYVEIAAYYIAERHGFTPGREVADWAEAEAEIDRLLGGGHFNP